MSTLSKRFSAVLLMIFVINGDVNSARGAEHRFEDYEAIEYGAASIAPSRIGVDALRLLVCGNYFYPFAGPSGWELMVFPNGSVYLIDITHMSISGRVAAKGKWTVSMGSLNIVWENILDDEGSRATRVSLYGEMKEMLIYFSDPPGRENRVYIIPKDLRGTKRERVFFKQSIRYVDWERLVRRFDDDLVKVQHNDGSLEPKVR